MVMFDKKIDYETKCTELEQKIKENDEKMLKFSDKISILQEELNFAKLEKSDMNDKINELGLLNFDLKNDNKKMADNLRDISDNYNRLIDENKKLKQAIADNNINITKVIDVKHSNSEIAILKIDTIIGLSALKKDSTGYKFNIFLNNSQVININMGNEININSYQLGLYANEEYNRIKNAIS